MKLIFEAALFLPSKVVLFRLTLFYLLYDQISQVGKEPFFGYAVIGIAAYVFPLKWLCRLIFDKFPEGLKYAWDKGKEDFGD